MKRSFFLLPLGLMLVSSVGHADPITIPLPPPTPLNPDGTGGGGGVVKDPAKPVATKKAAEYTDDELRAMGVGVAFPYELLDSVLRRYTSPKGSFSYLQGKDDNDLATFARAVAIADTSQFPIFTVAVDKEDPAKGLKNDTSAELTFWINAYNGLRLKALADSYPVVSVLPLSELDTAKNQTVAGKKYSFVELRDKIGKMDPRALFAITSGASDGPTVPLSVYRFSRLSDQLEMAMKAFVNDPNKVSPPDRLANKVDVSPYFQQVDTYFKPKNGRRKFEGIRYILSLYCDVGASRNYFTTGEYTINFSLANARLNEQQTRN